MHPFYPAFVKVVRPRFEGYAAEALMAHPLLTLGGWDPMKSVKWLLRFAQGFLETHGRVALDDARNDAAAHPSAYAAAEHALCRLELLSGARPAWAAAHPALFAGRGAEVDTELDAVASRNAPWRRQSAPSCGSRLNSSNRSFSNTPWRRKSPCSSRRNGASSSSAST